MKPVKAVKVLEEKQVNKTVLDQLGVLLNMLYKKELFNLNNKKFSKK